MNNFPRTGRMTTGIERVFRQTFDGLYREMHLHWIHFLNEEGNVISSKLDKTTKGRLYKIASGDERSLYGEVEYKFPDQELPVRMVALGYDREDERYGRF